MYCQSDKSKVSKRKSKWRLMLIILIICVAVVLKNKRPHFIDSFADAVSEELKVEEAVNMISGTENVGTAIEVSGDTEIIEEDESVFYIENEDIEKLQTEIEQARKREEENRKKESIETLSFQMSTEELADDTEAEIFRIPPPSSCSYEKAELNFKYKLPLNGIVTSKFGYRDHPLMNDSNFHTGVDIAAKKGSAIVSFADGIVADSGKNATYGNYLLVKHTDEIYSFYGHNSKLCVKKGAKVSLGQKIAEVGSTGMSTGPHLHFEVRKNSIRIDPQMYILKTVAK